MTHDELLELMPLLALDALSAEERELARRHMAECARCAAEVESCQQLSAELLTRVPAAPWAPNLETGLRGRMQAVQLSPSRVAGTRRSMFSAWRLAVTALALAFAVLAAFAGWQWWRAQDPNAAELAELMLKPGTVSVSLQPTDRAPAASAQVILNPENTRAYLVVNNLAPIQIDQVYQVWLIHDGYRDNAGTFRVDAQGRATARIWATMPWGAYQEIGVTLEPGRGSPAPTTPRLIGGKLR